MDKDDCREMFTRNCPITGCVNLPCARFESTDETRWALDMIEWEKEKFSSRKDAR